MKNFVSRTRVSAVAVLVAVTIAWAVFAPHGFLWPGLAGAALAGVVALWVAKRSNRSTRSMIEVIGDVEAEPALAAAAPSRAVVSPKAVL